MCIRDRSEAGKSHDSFWPGSDREGLYGRRLFYRWIYGLHAAERSSQGIRCGCGPRPACLEMCIRDRQLTLWKKEESREAAAGVQAAGITVEEITLDDSERTSEPGETVPVDPAGLKLRSQIADKYGLEEDHVEIQWEN